MILICFHPIEFNQITPINEKKALKTNFDNNSHREHELKRPQRTSNDFKTNPTNTKSNKRNKMFLKSGSIKENIAINDEYLGEVLHNNNS